MGTGIRGRKPETRVDYHSLSAFRNRLINFEIKLDRYTKDGFEHGVRILLAGDIMEGGKASTVFPGDENETIGSLKKIAKKIRKYRSIKKTDPHLLIFVATPEREAEIKRDGGYKLKVVETETLTEIETPEVEEQQEPSGDKIKRPDNGPKSLEEWLLSR